MERNDVLNHYLCDLRRSAKLSVEQVCLRTKIQARFVDAIEAGRWGEVPSNTHLRAFSLAMAKACGGDEALTANLVRRLLAATAPPASEERRPGFDTPSPAPLAAGRDNLSPSTAFPGQAALASAGGGSLDAPLEANSLAAASVRLRSLPLSVLLTLLALAGTLSYGAAWSVEHWRLREVARVLGSVSEEAASQQAAAQAVVAPPAAPVKGPAASAPLAVVHASSDKAAAGTEVLTLRARRACWLVLEIDGKRLPTITLQDGDKLNWNVSQRAVMLAGNIGALRVWWQGDNEGYLGDLDQRANAVVFEPGRAPRFDKSAALSLPVGIPQ